MFFSVAAVKTDTFGSLQTATYPSPDGQEWRFRIDADIHEVRTWDLRTSFSLAPYDDSTSSLLKKRDRLHYKDIFIDSF